MFHMNKTQNFDFILMRNLKIFHQFLFSIIQNKVKKTKIQN
jgi:hypothetical protein